MDIAKFFGYKKVNQETPSTPSSVVYHPNIGYGHNYTTIDKVWDGEKTLGELGAPVNNIPNFDQLRIRSYDAYATKDIVKIIASKYFYWTIGSGLKLQSEPNRNVLESEGINNVQEKYSSFQKLVESRFMVYANSKQGDYLKQQNIHEVAMDCYQGTFLGGDTLVIARFDNNGPNIQLISGEHLRNPEFTDSHYVNAEENGNKIEHGIEVDAKGSHVAYYVNTKPKSKSILVVYERIPAIGAKSGKRLAWLVSGKKISPDHLRAVPAMSQSLEKINKLDRYTEASVSKAEQAANVVYALEHKEFSTGEDILRGEINKKRGEATTNEPTAQFLGDGLANRISQTTSGTAYNLPVGAEMKSFDTNIESNFGEFQSAIFDIISASVDMPPEVAMQKYSSNYSASRAAINSFGYIISINRNKFANDFYIPLYKLWLEFQILNNKIDAPGYVENRDNFMVTESYSQCRFIGKNMPHIDPLKEIKAVREMLGINDSTPLISREQATELLNAGQWDENFMKSLEESKIIPKEEEVPIKKENDAK